MPAHPMTKEQAEATIAAWVAAGHNASQASRTLKIPRPTFDNRLARSKQILGIERPTLAPAAVPEGYREGKSTVQYDAAGNVVNEWRRIHPVAEALETISARLCETLEGKAPKLPNPPKTVPDDLMLEVPIFDPHFGKYAWAEETGADYDLGIVKRIVVGGVQRLAEQAGPVGTALLVIGGDTLHADNRHSVTERGGHVLDVDTRQGKVWEVLTDSITASVSLLASTAKRVRIVVIPGNHDFESSFHLGRLLAAYYRNEKAVSVTHGPKTRHYVRHGCVLLGFAHGHLLKMDSLATLMAEETREDWAQTKQRVWHLGHVHVGRRMNWMTLNGVHGVEVEHIESVSAADSWHAEMGYVGMPRRLTSFLWSAKNGLRSRHYVGVEDFEGKES